jgi:heptosyltransferase-2
MCEDCSYYEPKKGKVLIIKLGAIGDVIRTTPILKKVWEEYSDSEIWWITDFPSVVPDKVDRVFKFDAKSILTMQNTEFDYVINLDKDYEACGLTKSLTTKKLDGFTMRDGKPVPANERAEQKYLTGLFDNVNKANTKSYPEEIFEICGWKFNKEPYIIDYLKQDWDLANQGRKIVGLNTGCGDRWTSRLIPDSTWIELINKLKENGYYPLLLGGSQEHYKNEYLAATTKAAYLGHFSLNKFISLISECDLVVSAVTMGAHLAIGLRKPLILVNNIFNAEEFELYGRGEIVEPTKQCHCFFSAKCTNDDYSCIDLVSADMLYEAVVKNIEVKV